jgi:hypothetical protein
MIEQCQAAIAQYTNSVQGDNLGTYLAQCKSFTKTSSVEQMITQLPPPFNTLLSFQHDDGLFRDLYGVLQSLQLPKYMREKDEIMPRASESQYATALAVAAMRQRIDLFDELQDAHDIASRHVHNGLIMEARDLLVEGTLTPEEYVVEYADEIRKANAVKEFIPPSPARTGGEAAKEQGNVPGSSSSAAQLHIDKEQSGVLQEKIEQCGAQITDKLIQLDVLVDSLRSCLDRNIAIFLGTDQLTVKNAAFDELTARLGQGLPPREGFQDWRKEGVPGLRPFIIDILNNLQDLADLRLAYQECTTVAPLLSKMHLNTTLYFSNGNRGRWAFHYNGEDAVTKILHWLVASAVELRYRPVIAKLFASVATAWTFFVRAENFAFGMVASTGSVEILCICR